MNPSCASWAKHPASSWDRRPACPCPAWSLSAPSWDRRPACPSPAWSLSAPSWDRRPACPCRGPRTACARAFTLVELLVVIGIIGLLAAIITPVVMQSLTKARNAAIKAEIDMLHMAIMNYKNEYGSFPAIENPAVANGPATRHLRKLFPRCNTIAAQRAFLGDIAFNTAIVKWLSGYTDDPLSPVLGEDANGNGVLDGGEDTNGNAVLDNKRKKFFDFDVTRITSNTYFPSGKPGSPYIYIPAANYLAIPYTNSTLSSPRAHFNPPRPLSPLPPAIQAAVQADERLLFTDLALASPQNQEFANPETFQILCAGRDEIFGNDDDLSNFWPGTRREYLDSLKDQ
jgi:prepilin-type N-terminal cleavage/methylation domain-containing protein